MKKTIYSLVAIIISFYIVTVPNVVSAEISESFCDITPTQAGDVAPELNQIVCPFLRIYNFSILAAGVVLIGMIALGGIRLAMSLGDPKGYESATRTFTYTLWGLAIVLGSFLIMRIIMYTLGVSLGFPTPLTLFSRIGCALERWMEFALITPTNSICP